MHKFYLLLVLFIGIHTNAASAKVDFDGDLFTVKIEGEGPPLLLIPGLMSDARVWQPLQAELANHYELHLVSVKGFGETAPPNQSEMITTGWLQALSGELGEYIYAHSEQDFRIVGHSMGGFLAMAIAIENPDKVISLVSVDGMPYLAPIFTRNPATRPDDMRVNAQQMLAYYQSLQTEQALAAVVAQGVVLHAASDEHQRMVVDMSAQSDADVVGVAVHDLLQWDLRDDLPKLTQPLLLLGATGALPDNMQDQATALYAQQLENLPATQNGEILKIRRSSRHFMMYDDPEWLIAQILGHL